MIIREARPEDYELVERLYKEMCPNDPVEVLPERIQEFLDSKRDFLLVCEVDNKPVATLTINICLNAELGKQDYAIFENIVVLEEYRDRGIGSELLRFAEDFVRKNNCEKIMFLSSVKRTKAHEFFRKLGFSDEISKGFKKYLIEMENKYLR